VTGAAASQAAQRLRVAPRAPLRRAVAAPVSGLVAVEAEAVRAVAGEVPDESAEVARSFLRGESALSFAVAAAAASEATLRGELEVVVEVPRHAEDPAHLIALTVFVIVVLRLA